MGGKNEDPFRLEASKFAGLIDLILDFVADGKESGPDPFKADMFKRRIKTCLATIGVKYNILDNMEKDPQTFYDNLRDLINQFPSLGTKEFIKNAIWDKIRPSETVKLTNFKNTDCDEFQIGKRIRKSKGNHPVLKFIEDLKHNIEDGSLLIKANQPIKNVFKNLNTYYEEKIE